MPNRARLDVPFQYPLGGPLLTEDNEALFDGVLDAAAFAKTVGVGVGGSFGDGVERELVEGLHSAVCHGGDA